MNHINMEAALKTAVVRLQSPMPENSIVEVESRIKYNMPEFIKVLRAISNKNFVIERRMDIVTGEGLCRITYVGDEIRKEMITKAELTPGINPNIKIEDTVISVKLETVTPYKGVGQAKSYIIKFRAITTIDDWQIDFVAQVFALDQQDFVNRQRIYFAQPVKTIDDFIDVIEKRILAFDQFYVEMEALNLAAEETDESLKLRMINYNTIFQTIFSANIHAILYRKLILEIAQRFLPSYSQDREISGRYTTLKTITPQVETVSLDTLTDPNLFPFNNWYLTDKADGVHAMLYFNREGGAYLIEEQVQSFIESYDIKSFYGGRWGSSESNDKVVVIEGEYLDHDKKGKTSQFLAFDLLYAYGVNYTNRTYGERLQKLSEIIERVNRSIKGIGPRSVPYAPRTNFDLVIQMKEFAKLDSSDMVKYGETIQAFAAKLPLRPYNTDGLIFVKPGDFLSTKTYKWKPTSNTIDFLMRKIPAGADNGIFASKKDMTTYLLFVSISAVQHANMLIQELPFFRVLFPNLPTGRPIRPIQFAASLAPNAYIHHDTRADLDGKIVELLPEFSNGKLTWHFERIRADREADYAAGSYYGNNIKVADINLSAARFPITVENLAGHFGDKYFKSNKAPMHSAATKHNNRVKEQLWKTYHQGSKWVVDMAAGRGSDIYNYASHGAEQVLALEYDKVAIQTLLMRRYQMANQRSSANVKMPLIHLIEQDLRKPAAEVIEKIKLYNPPTVVHMGKSIIAIPSIMCNFAIHYLVNPAGNTANFVNLVSGLIAPGGYFTFTCFDNYRVNELLAKGDWIVMSQNIIKYRIRKEGNKLKLLLPFTQGEDIDEFIFDLDAVIHEFRTRGYSVVIKKNFLDFDTGVSLDEHDRIFVGLYAAVCVKAK